MRALAGGAGTHGLAAERARWWRRILFLTRTTARRIQALGEAAVAQEGLFQSRELPPELVTGLVMRQSKVFAAASAVAVVMLWGSDE